MSNSLRGICFLVLPIFIAFFSHAQPANDVCSSAEVVPLDGTCVGGTTSGGSDDWQQTVGCQSGNNHNEVWYTFTADSNSVIISITALTLTGNVELIVAANESKLR